MKNLAKRTSVVVTALTLVAFAVTFSGCGGGSNGESSRENSESSESSSREVPTTSVAPDGLALYNQNCSGCHGTSKLGKSAVAIQSAITANIGGMGALKALTATQITAIAATTATVQPPAPAATATPAVTPAPTPVLDGAALYAQYCAGCHASAKRGKTAVATQNAINTNRGGMGSLSTLTSAQVSAIAAW